MISGQHANFIVNTGGARLNIEALIETARGAVK